MFRPLPVTLLRAGTGLIAGAFLFPVSASALDVQFEKIARTGDPMPGRESLNVVFNGRAFQANQQPGVLSKPVINESGDVVFRGVGSHPSNFNQDATIGIYAKPAGQALIRLVDMSVVGGVPAFPVPGRPAGTTFGNFDPPLMNNNGDVVFRATYTGGGQPSGQGWYATHVTGGPIVAIVDSSTAVPGWSTTTFDRGFNFAFSSPVYSAALNDAGQFVFHGRFQRSGASFEDSGLYGTTVAGGAIVRLVDTTATVVPAGNTQTFRSISQPFPPALNNNGDVIFQASIGPIASVTSAGIFTIPVTGGQARIRALQSQTVPLSTGTGTFTSIFGGGDVTDSGLYSFQHAFGNQITSIYGVFGGQLAGSGFTSIHDGATPGSVPGRSGANWRSLRVGALNESGAIAFYGGDSAAVPGMSSGDGIYYDNVSTDTPVTLIANNGMTAPGLSAPNVLWSFSFRSPVINDAGNVVFANDGFDGVNDALFGLYFYDACATTLNRIVDRTTSAAPLPVGLGGAFANPGCAGTPCERGIFIWDDLDARSGRFRCMTSNNDVAFLSAFSTFDVGIYVAHVDASGGGTLTIAAPADLALECGDDTSPASTGEATAEGCGTVVVSYSDSVTNTCGGGHVIERTWSASNGGDAATAVQTITVTDETPPTLTCPSDTSVACSENNAAELQAWIDLASASDSCSSVQLTYDVEPPVGSCGDTVVTFTATDDCGNSTTCAATFTVADTTPPAIIAPDDLVLECGGVDHSAAIDAWLATASASDSCGSVSLENDFEPITFDCNVSHAVTWTATDACGNTSTATATITVQDTQPPMLSTDIPVIVGVDPGACTASNVTLGNVSAHDACGEVTLTNDAPAVFPLGTTFVTWTATDSCGNTTSAPQAVTVVNLEPIAVIQLQQITNIGLMASVRFDGNASSDPEDPASSLTYRWTIDGVVQCDGSATSCDQIVRPLAYGEHTVSLRVTDTCGNSNEVTQSVVVSPAELSVFEVSRMVVNFCQNPPRLRINGQVGLPVGVSHTELEPRVKFGADVAGVTVLPLTEVALNVNGSGRAWRYNSNASVGLRKLNITWSGSSYLFRDAGFPVELRSDSISTTETLLEMRVRRPNQLPGGFTMTVGSAYITFDEDMDVVASNVAYEVEVARKRFLLTLPFPLLESTDIVFSGGLDRVLSAGNGLSAAVGRYHAVVFFNGALLPQGANSTPKVVGADMRVGLEGYPGGNECNGPYVTGSCAWQTPDGCCDEEEDD